MTHGLGENATGALNALVPVPASGGGRRPCARALVDSQDALSVFVATVVEDHAYN